MGKGDDNVRHQHAELIVILAIVILILGARRLREIGACIVKVSGTSRHQSKIPPR
jgi:Sec-independent protein translocase protein TatA